jgi:hypothetical protein
VRDNQGETEVSIYNTDNNGNVNYAYGYPMFLMQDPYTFIIEGYEEYVNADESPSVTSRVPLKDVVVTIDNAMSAEQEVMGVGYEDEGSVVNLKSNQLQLDEEGSAVYTWKAGMPNIVSPYTRTINISYDIDGRIYNWNDGVGLTAIVLGELPTGNNFVTAGTDHLDMILRDPPGSGSSAEWSKGQVTSKTHAYGGTWSTDNQITTTCRFGATIELATGTPGAFVLSEAKSTDDMVLGVHIVEEGEEGDSWSRTVSTTRTVSTSDDSDFVGADGDLFIGSSTNIIFGTARRLGLNRVGTKMELGVNDAITTGLNFETEFMYSQKYIKETLLPNFETIRNSKLKHVDKIEGYVNNSDEPVYLTTLNETDLGYGSNNNDKDVWGAEATPQPSTSGKSYTMVMPAGFELESGKEYTDSVEWCNNQIASWIKHLRYNEESKAKAYKKRKELESQKKVDNYSFDAGSSMSYSKETDDGSTHFYDNSLSVALIASNAWGVVYNGTGVEWQLATETGGGAHWQDENSTDSILTFSYTFAEEGVDAITVDVYDYDSFGPIFRTRGGQTCAPYEGEVRQSTMKTRTAIIPLSWRPRCRLRCRRLMWRCPW